MARTGWSIDAHRITVHLDAMFVMVAVDEEAPVLRLSNRLLGEWPFRAGTRQLVFKRVRNLDVARSELWSGGVRIPPTELRLPSRQPEAGSRCAIHPDGGGTYRDAGAPSAMAACGECRTAVCAGCLGADGVRCRRCFDQASAAMLQADTAARRMGYLLAYALSVFIVLAGVAGRFPKVAGIGLSAVVFTTFILVRGLLAERRERRAQRPQG